MIVNEFVYKLLERFKVDKQIYGFDNNKTVFETDFCTDNVHVIAKMYTFLLKYERKKNR